MDFNLEIGLILLEELALIALPAIAAAMFGATRGIRSPVLLIGIALTASGAATMLVFWAFYVEPLIGKTLAYLLVFGAAAAIVSLWFEGRGRAALRELGPFCALGAVVGGEPDVLEWRVLLHRSTGVPRSSPNGSTDGTKAPPAFPGTRSDRPPLQIAYTLALRPFGWDGRSLHYQPRGGDHCSPLSAAFCRCISPRWPWSASAGSPCGPLG